MDRSTRSLPTDGTVYIGGDFNYVGPLTGPMTVFDAGTGH